MEFPVSVKTRAGSEVTLIRYDKDNDRPWVGLIKVDLQDSSYYQPHTWLESGHYHSKETNRSLDLILSTAF